MAQHKPWAKTADAPPDAETDAPPAPAMTMAEIAALPTIDAQLRALNGAPVPPLSVEECHVVQGIASAWAMTVAYHGVKPDRDILRGVLHAGFQVMRPYVSEEQQALGTVDQSLPN